MNTIKYNFPKEITICGQKCPIRNDLKTWGRVHHTLCSNKSNTQTACDLIKLVFIEVPPNLFEALQAIKKICTYIFEHGEIVFDAPPEES